MEAGVHGHGSHNVAASKVGEPRIDMASSAGSAQQNGRHEDSPLINRGAPDGVHSSCLKVFHFATALDWVLIVFGVLLAVATGMGIPALVLLIRDLVNEGFSRGASGIGSRQIASMAQNFMWIGLAIFGSSWVSNVCLQMAAARQGLRVRIEYLRGLLRQDLTWQEQHGGAALAVNFEADCADVQAGIGEKLFQLVQNLAIAVGCVALGLWQAWHMTLILLGALPFLFVIAFITSRQVKPYAAVRESAWRQASGVMEETLAGIRTTASLAAEPWMLQAFGRHLSMVQQFRGKEVLVSAVGVAVLTLLTFAAFALGLWFGSWLQVREVRAVALDRFYNGSDTALCFFSVLIATFYLTQVGPAWAALQRAADTMGRVLQITTRRPAIDVEAAQGLVPAEAPRGRLQLQDVHFHYPSRPQSAVLRAVSLDVPAGSKVALVGASGSGKSSVLMLAMRFYDPTSGAVLLDGADLRSLNVKWLRQHFGFVSQEPLLFAASVAENVRITAPAASQEEVEAACRSANAHDFIQALPERYETMCGERGAGLSGGQKQRIAIARCIIANPKMLLLDEATSALDSDSERLVQAAMEEVSSGRTTLVVAHRLSTVRDASCIVVLDKGRVLEQGTHQALLDKGQAYSKLVQAQTLLGSSDIALEEDDAEGAGAEGAGGGTVSADGSKPPSLEGSAATALDADDGKSYFELAGVGGALLPRPPAPHSNWKAFCRILAASARFPGPLGAGCLGVVLTAGVVPLLSYMIVEMIRVLFFCFQVRVPIFIDHGREHITVGYYDDAQGCEAECNFNIINGLGIQPRETCTYPNGSWVWPELCMDLGRFSIKFYTDELRYGCYDEMTDDVIQYCIWVVLTGVAAAIAILLQYWGMRALADNLGRQLRLSGLAAILRQDMSFFDKPARASAALSALLLQDVSMVQDAVAVTMGFLVVNFLLAVGSMVLGIFRGWVLALICTAVFPGKFLLQALRSCYDSRFSGVSRLQQASLLAVESIGSVRTVAANSLNERVLALYQLALPRINALQVLITIGSGFWFGVSLFLQFMVYFVAFIVGANFMVWPPLDPEDPPYSFLGVLQVFFSVAFMGFAVQLMGSLLSDLVRALRAAARVFECIDSEPLFSPETRGETPPSVTGEIEFRNVVFHYPERPEAVVLDGLSFMAGAGATTALVGASGSGKSTIIQLLERFYDPASGSVMVDGVDVRRLDLRWLRRQMALVSQEPVLFNASVAENIRYGKEGASHEEVEAAARKANAHDFIAAFANGYETMCGERGAGLSGGQKQRIAIARCIIANPKMLLLDEATSALDSDSERLVQAALDKVGRSRTCVVVAHRLSTIRRADKIVVLSRGKIVEQGTHSQLLQDDGAYAKLIRGQLAPKAVVAVGASESEH